MEGTPQPARCGSWSRQRRRFDAQAHRSREVSVLLPRHTDPAPDHTRPRLVASGRMPVQPMHVLRLLSDSPYRVNRPRRIPVPRPRPCWPITGGLRSTPGVFLGQAIALLGPRLARGSPPDRKRPVPVAAARSDGLCARLVAGAIALHGHHVVPSTTFSGPRITADEFRRCRQLNLRHVYIGLETGADPLLKWLAARNRRAGRAHSAGRPGWRSPRRTDRVTGRRRRAVL